MPALVPLDKHTAYGPLFVVGTPLLDSYYARWSFDKNATNPQIHLQELDKADVCKDELQDAVNGDSVPTGLMRRELDGHLISRGHHERNRGPTTRLPEEIAFPHWAKSLLHI